jgi:hypothetical protein
MYFLQFPSLQATDIIWPAISLTWFGTGVTTVTTFTTFSLPLETNVDDAQKLSLEQHLPFLHALVQASDFLLSNRARGVFKREGSVRVHEA